ncbi:MAG: DUF3109 family protein [Bacteroidota bacterium]|nr:DUF3109 family protein [Bacteroidota bacterium]
MDNENVKVINGLKIDPKIFTFPFNCMCGGECCNYGVYTDLKENQYILTLKDEIIPLMDETQPKEIDKWFEQPEEDEDFKSGIAVGTEVFNGKCVFLDCNGLCTLQKLANLKNEYKWKYKPMYCVLFPLTIYEGALTIDDDHINRLHICNKQENNFNRTIFEACHEELVYLLGIEGYQELLDYKKEIESNTIGVETNDSEK